MKTSIVEKLSTYATGLLAFVCVLVPFHAFLTVWAGSSFGHYTAWRLWPEVLLTALILIAGAIAWRRPKILTALRRDPLMICIGLYAVLHIVLGVWALTSHKVTAFALADGLILNLRPVLFLVVAWIIALQNQWFYANWRKLLIIPATVVVGFGLLQVFVLPTNFLSHFGYGPHTIPAYETVDQKLDYIRAQSTLRGANPLGAYLVVVLPALAAVGWRKRATWVKVLLGADLAGAALILFYTYSRSAYLGALLTLGVFGWLSLKNARTKKYVLYAGAALFLIGASAVFGLRHNDRVQNTFFHTDEHSQSTHSSNQDRSSALQKGFSDLLHEPLGEGPGTAGPASAHNDHQVRIAENYYLQLGQEVGWLGLLLFVAITILIVIKLWNRRNDPLAQVLLASLAGITFINLLSHAWTDDTLAIVWWSFAGVTLAQRKARK